MGRYEQQGGEATGVVCQVSRPDECERLVRETRDIYGPVDVLINNAAVTSQWHVPVKDFPHGDWLDYWAVNLHTPFVLSKLSN